MREAPGGAWACAFFRLVGPLGPWPVLATLEGVGWPPPPLLLLLVLREGEKKERREGCALGHRRCLGVRLVGWAGPP